MRTASAADALWTLIGQRCRSAARPRVELELLFGGLLLALQPGHDQRLAHRAEIPSTLDAAPTRTLRGVASLMPAMIALGGVPEPAGDEGLALTTGSPRSGWSGISNWPRQVIRSGLP